MKLFVEHLLNIDILIYLSKNTEHTCVTCVIIETCHTFQFVNEIKFKDIYK